ncbi:unnamed protein product [Schistosoma curassoni]|uniref:Uncharacterized protein n=1 Tax=Schistosoma curassoni TaxID=6186 RepID=A0A183KGY7_9TREM|nr:unnamed protein product [Schistosoma curassoni]
MFAVLIEEIRMAIRKIKSGKEKGPNNISAEALMSDTKATASMLNVLFMKTREEEQVPIGLGRRIPNQDTKERRSEQM